MLPWGEYKPDVADYLGTATRNILNVLPRGDGYGPFKAFAAATQALPAACRGGFYALKSDGSVQVFAGTSKGLYRLNNTDLSWVNVGALANCTIAAQDDIDAFTKVLLHFEGADASTTFTDGGGHTFTANGNAQIDTADSKFGGSSGLFDGSGDYITASDSADFNLGSGDWTIDTWFKIDGSDAGGAQLLMAGQNDNAATATTISFYIERRTNNKIRILVGVGGSNFTAETTGSYTGSTNSGWHHLAAVRTGNSLLLFIDGALQQTTSMSGTINNSTNNFSVGRAGEIAGSEWHGWIDEFRLSVGVARWTTTFTPPTQRYAYAVVTYTNTFAANDPVVFDDGSGTLPSQIVEGTVYYVHATGLSGSSFSLSATPGGDRIDATGGTGTVKITAYYSALSSNAQWQFAQFGNLVFATQANAVLQVYNLSSSSQFADNSGSPPQAAYISVVGRFLVLSGLLSQPFRVQWSGLNDTTNWTSGVGSSDFQDFPDGGVVRGVAGGEFGTVFQDQAIRRMAYIPGSSLIFQIERVTQDLGLYAPYSIVRAGPTILFRAGQGFYKIDPGGYPTQIGRERVDRAFTADLDSTNLQLFIGASDPRSSRVYWAYKSVAGATGLYDKLLGYDIALDRFFTLSSSGEYLTGISQAGITLENLDTINASIDALTLTLDAYASSVQPQLAQWDSNHKQGFFTGDNVEAVMETAEQGTDSERIFVNGFKPITDASSFYGSASFRETVQDTPISTAEATRNSRTGRADLRKSTRYSRFKVRIPAATTWTYCAGVEPDTSLDGET